MPALSKSQHAPIIAYKLGATGGKLADTVGPWPMSRGIIMNQPAERLLRRQEMGEPAIEVRAAQEFRLEGGGGRDLSGHRGRLAGRAGRPERRREVGYRALVLSANDMTWMSEIHARSFDLGFCRR